MPRNQRAVRAAQAAAIRQFYKAPPPHSRIRPPRYLADMVGNAIFGYAAFWYTRQNVGLLTQYPGYRKNVYCGPVIGWQPGFIGAAYNNCSLIGGRTLSAIVNNHTTFVNLVTKKAVVNFAELQFQVNPISGYPNYYERNLQTWTLDALAEPVRNPRQLDWRNPIVRAPALDFARNPAIDSGTRRRAHTGRPGRVLPRLPQLPDADLVGQVVVGAAVGPPRTRVKPGVDSPGKGGSPPFPVSRPPARGTKERKAESSKPLMVKVFKRLDQISEQAEIVDAFYNALPPEIVKAENAKMRKMKRGLLDTAGQYGIDKADYKLRVLWRHWDKVDIPAAISNILANEVEDKIIGRTAGTVKKAYRGPTGAIGEGFGKGVSAGVDYLRSFLP